MRGTALWISTSPWRWLRMASRYRAWETFTTLYLMPSFSASAPHLRNASPQSGVDVCVRTVNSGTFSLSFGQTTRRNVSSTHPWSRRK